jgi:5-(carboxyamino)imidazole ribonucleotide synthase
MYNSVLNPEFRPLPPLSTIGILGGGQLGRMMAIAAAEMGYHVHIYCPEKNSPASEVTRFNTVGEYNDIKKLVGFAENVDVVTYEFENIPAKPVAAIAKKVNVFPSPQILATSQHRVLEKQAVGSMGIATAPFVPVSSLEELRFAARTIGLPAVLKTAMMAKDKLYCAKKQA